MRWGTPRRGRGLLIVYRRRAMTSATNGRPVVGEKSFFYPIPNVAERSGRIQSAESSFSITINDPAQLDHPHNRVLDTPLAMNAGRSCRVPSTPQLLDDHCAAWLSAWR